MVLGGVLASCTPTVSGLADAGDVPPLTSEEALGDLATVDFCSLLDERGLRESDVSVELATSGFLRCYAEVELGEVGLAVTIGDLYEGAPSDQADESRELARSVQRHHFEEDWGCWRELVFSDNVVLDVTARELYGDIAGAPGDAEMCRVADLVTDGVQQALYLDDSETMAFADGSLAELEPCSLLTADEAADILGVESVLPAPAVGGGGCSWWWYDEQYVGTDVEFEVIDLGTDASDHYDEDIDGRPTRGFVGEGHCVLETPHMLVPAEVPTEWEVVSVYVYDEEGDPCAAATELAELVWPRLPEYEG